jgi:phage baseplate assembly protein W
MAGLEDYLGYGLQRPFQRDGKQGFAAAGGTEHLNAKIGQVLGTKKGELPWDTEFGSDLDRLRHMPNNVDIVPIARRYTADALERWVPDVVVTQFRCERVKDTEGAETKLKIQLLYDLRPQRAGDAVLRDQAVEVIV